MRAVQASRAIDSKRSHRQQPITKISYIKTHKTASSTLGSIIFRYAAHHNLTLYKNANHALNLSYYNPQTIPANAVVHHYAGIATNLQSIEQWERAYRWYRRVVPGGTFVTILREPISHYVSYYYFYNEPSRKETPPLAGFVAQGSNRDILMRDFGVKTREEMDKFMKVKTVSAAGKNYGVF